MELHPDPGKDQVSDGALQGERTDNVMLGSCHSRREGVSRVHPISRAPFLLAIAVFFLTSCCAFRPHYPWDSIIGSGSGAAALWATSRSNSTYPPRPGNTIDIHIDGEDAYKAISDAFHNAKEFIYLTISFGDTDFVPVPYKDTMFDILRCRAKHGVDVRMVIWQPGMHQDNTIPDQKIEGVNDKEKNHSIQARWDKAKGYETHFWTPFGHDHPMLSRLSESFSESIGCHHQKTYVMDDGKHGIVAFVGGINPVQSYWDTSAHDSLDRRRVKPSMNLIKGLKENPPLHDIFYEIKGPAVADVLANFVERFNGASIKHKDATSDLEATVTAIPRVAGGGIQVRVVRTIAPGRVEATVTAIPEAAGGIQVQVVRTIAPDTYRTTTLKGDWGISEIYQNMLAAAGQGDIVYIENQYFFDPVAAYEISAAADRGAKIIILLESNPDLNTVQGEAEKQMEIEYKKAENASGVRQHKNVVFLTLGNSTGDPRNKGKFIYSETYIHSKTMAVIGNGRAYMTGGSANIASTSMLFHSEMNIAFDDTELIKKWIKQLWVEHLKIKPEEAADLLANPDEAFTFFKAQARCNQTAVKEGRKPHGCVYFWDDFQKFPKPDLKGIPLDDLSGKEAK